MKGGVEDQVRRMMYEARGKAWTRLGRESLSHVWEVTSIPSRDFPASQPCDQAALAAADIVKAAPAPSGSMHINTNTPLVLTCLLLPIC